MSMAMALARCIPSASVRYIVRLLRITPTAASARSGRPCQVLDTTKCALTVAVLAARSVLRAAVARLIVPFEPLPQPHSGIGRRRRGRCCTYVHTNPKRKAEHAGQVLVVVVAPLLLRAQRRHPRSGRRAGAGCAARRAIVVQRRPRGELSYDYRKARHAVHGLTVATESASR